MCSRYIPNISFALILSLLFLSGLHSYFLSYSLWAVYIHVTNFILSQIKVRKDRHPNFEFPINQVNSS